MWERYKQPVMVAGLLFVVAAVAGLIGNAVNHYNRAVAVEFGLTAVVMAVVAYLWVRRAPLSRVVPDVLLTMTIACLLLIFVVPYIAYITAKGKYNWNADFTLGAGSFFSKIWIYYGCGLISSAFGWMIAVAFGQDYRAKQLKHYATTVTTKPHRAVRR